MDTLSAYANALANKGAPFMVFDWDKAAALIRDRKPQEASAGLASDWENTGGMIWRDGKPVIDQYTYLASNWATPELDMDGEVTECFRLKQETPGWDAHTKWPESALRVLSANDKAQRPGPL
jgi:hypothetical protein